MGVQGLWELLAPVGRRVSVETLAGKKLAIDASIWMVQFMKAMRDEKGEMVRNAHILGFFRRICKLLFLRTKPVFVFDGGTPALKRRTVVARRRQRENAQAKIRKTAEKLLLNHLKARKLEELANDIKNMKDKDDAKGKKVVSESEVLTENRSERDEKVTGTHSQEFIDELLAASLAAEEDWKFVDNASTSVVDVPSEEEDDEDENEEMILPLMHSNVDPTVLAALPPSMQLDLLVQMRERLMAENRQKYQKVKKAPTKFSELQIQAYLKTVAFRREIDEVQKSAAGRGVGGVQTSRIASEANREFIFSSSFTGDKQILTSAGAEKNGDTEHQIPAKQTNASEPTDCIPSTARFDSVTEASTNDVRKDFDNDVETYIDERGRVRVSRLRALGIRMTRDLQRNLDLMKEFELEKVKEHTHADAEAIGNNNVLGAPKITENSHPLEVSAGDEVDDEMSLIGRMDKTSTQGENNHLHEPSILGGKTAMEISFLEDDSGPHGTDDDDGLFAHLVAASSISKFSSEGVLSGNHSGDFSSDCAMEKGMVQRNGGSFNIDVEEESPSFVDGDNSDEGEVNWEEGVYDVPGNASCSNDDTKTISRGSLEEEADIQEAIRRSLEDFTMEKSVPMSSETEREDLAVVSRSGLEEMTGFSLEDPVIKNDSAGSPGMPLSDVLQNQASCKTVDGVEGLEALVQRDISQNNGSPEKHSVSFITMGVEISEGYRGSNLGRNEVTEDTNVCVETQHLDQITSPQSMAHQITGQEKCLDNSNQHEKEASFSECPNGSSKISYADDAVASDLTDVVFAGAHPNDVPPSCHSSELTKENSNFQEDAFKDQTTNNNREQELVAGKNHGIPPDEGWKYRDKITCHGNLEASAASLDEEMLVLRQERMDLGDEQRKLERNAESVSSEMFAECQELLQMFGLPYIIAPMEAEAQCAYMELMNLVDGVVTDDSDVFLFGARSVYKNIFDDRKYVETYFMKDVESELGLPREKLILMALLLGSDYTEGVSGIGIVNAIEVVNAFPEEDGLQKFREWLESPDPAIFGKLNAHTGNNSRKKRLKAGTNGAKCSTNNVDGASEECTFTGHDDQQSEDSLPDIKQIFMDKHRNVSKNWHIPSSFPSESVISAYTSPQVEKSTEPFSWGKPDLFVLRKLCWERLGWSNKKADELLIPVLKEYNKHETQLRLEAFYTFNERFAKIRSQRIKKAVKGIAGNGASELMDDPAQVGSKSRKRKVSPSGTESNMSEKPSDGTNDSIGGNEPKASENTAPKQPRKRRIEDQFTESEVWHSTFQKEGRSNARTIRRGNARGRGRGRAGRGRKSEVLSYESTETSSSDGDNSNDEKQIKVERTKGQSGLRRSARPLKQVKYREKDANGDSLSSSSNQSDGYCSDTLEQNPFSDHGIVGDACGPNNENQGSDPPLESNSSRDYIFSGGGFCIGEDDDQNGNPSQQVPGPTLEPEDLLNSQQRIVSSVTGSSNDADVSGNDCSTNIYDSQLENVLGEHQDESGKIPHAPVIEEKAAIDVGLTAMPALRRKRKKT